MKIFYITIVIAFVISAVSDKCMAQWTPVYQDVHAQFYDAAFPTDYSGFVAASDTGGTVVLRTSNGGIAWNKKYIRGWDFISKIVMIDSVTGYLIKGGAPGKILKSNDAFSSYTAHYLDS